MRCHCHGQGPLLSTLGNYLKWRFTDSHSDTTYQIQCRAIHTLHKLSMRCAACKEARYLSPSHSDCDSYFLNLIFGRIMLRVGKACTSSNCTVQIMGWWDCNDWSCCQTTSLSNLWRMQMPRTISMKSTWGLDLKTHCPQGTTIWLRGSQSFCLSSFVIIGYHWYQLQHQFTLRIIEERWPGIIRFEMFWIEVV